MPIKTEVTFLDETGNTIEKTIFDSSEAAAEEVSQFIIANADEEWEEAGAAKPGPDNYTIKIRYKR